jgi:hypothetical protein
MNNGNQASDDGSTKQSEPAALLRIPQLDADAKERSLHGIVLALAKAASASVVLPKASRAMPF